MTTPVLDPAISGTANNGTGVTATSVVVGAAATRLIAFVSLELAAGPPPTSVIRNSATFTLLGSHKDTLGGGIYNISAWYLDNPTVGTFNTVASWTGSTSGAGICCVPVENCDLTRVPSIGTGADGNSTAPACTAPTSSANDLSLAGLITTATAGITAAGTGQSVIPSTPTLPRLSINGANSFSADFILAGDAGSFVWTTSSNVWSAIGLTLFGIPLAPLQPFTSTQFFVTDTIIQQ